MTVTYVTPRILLIALAAVACAPSAAPEARSPIPAAEAANLARPEPQALVTDYSAGFKTYRLYGTQTGDRGRFATVADIATWETRDVFEGDVVGRNLRVARIDDGSVTFEDAQGSARLEVGRDVRVREVQHRYDTAARYQGRHRWSIDPADLGEIRERYGVGVQGIPRRLFERDVLRLDVEPDGLLGRSGLRTGDLLVEVDGAPVTEGSLEAVADRLTSARSGRIQLSVYRGGTLIVSTYDAR